METLPIAYLYNHITKEYIGSTYCSPSPREKGVYLKPADSTTTKPIEKDGFKPYYNPEEDTWFYKIDFTNKILYDIRDKSLVENPIEEDKNYYTEKVPPNDFVKWNENKWVIDLDLVKRCLLPFLYRDGIIYNYYLNNKINIPNVGVINANYETLWFLKDVREVLTNTNKNELDKFRLYDNTFKSLTLEDVFNSIFVLQKYLMEAKQDLMFLKDSILNANTLKELNEIEINIKNKYKEEKIINFSTITSGIIENNYLKIEEAFR